jgi:hypothetical protein
VVTLGPAVTKGEFLGSVKAIKAITITIAAMTPTMAPLPHSPSRSLRFGIASPPWNATSPLVQRDLTGRMKYAPAEERSSDTRTGDTRMLPVPDLSFWEEWSKSLASHPRISSIE